MYWYWLLFDAGTAFVIYKNALPILYNRANTDRSATTAHGNQCALRR